MIYSKSCPDGGTGRRVGFKRNSKESRFAKNAISKKPDTIALIEITLNEG
jgi:hypothetical protein